MATWKKVVVESGSNTIAQNTTGSAATLTNAQNFSLTGDVSASAVSFNGSSAVQLTTTIGNGAVDFAMLAGAAVITSTETIASNDSDTALPTAAAVIDYVDAQITAEDLDFSADSGSGSIDLDSETLRISGTANEIVTAASGNDITIGLPDDVTIGGDLTVTGDLTVSGSTTTIDTTNLLVEDTFIALNSNGSTNVDAGIVFTGAANKVFGWDQSQESGRFGVDYAGGDASVADGGFSPDAWVSTVHTAAGDSSNATAALAQIGNFYVNSSNSDVYIYS